MDENKNIKRVEIPRIRTDGQAVELVVITESDDKITLTVPAAEFDKVAANLMRVLTSAKLARTLHPEIAEEFKPSPVLYHAAGVAFVSQPNHDIAYLVVPTLQDTEVQICFQWHQVRALVELAQKFDGIQESPDSNLPS